MTKLVATIIEVENVDNLHIVKFDLDGIALTMMSLDLHVDMSIGTKVTLGVKPLHVAIAKNLSGLISYSNQIKSKIVSIDKGILLSSIKLKVKEFGLESVITTDSLDEMDLHVDDEVLILIKANELSIVEVCQ